MNKMKGKTGQMATNIDMAKRLNGIVLHFLCPTPCSVQSTIDQLDKGMYHYSLLLNYSQ